MKNVYHLCLLIFICAGCKNDTVNYDPVQKYPSTTASAVPVSDTLLNVSLARFQHIDDTLEQVLEWRVTPDSHIKRFEYTLNDKKKNSSQHIFGFAKLLPQVGDGEMDVDDEGVGYFIDEYSFRNDSCKIIFRMDADENYRARAVFYNTGNLNVYKDLGVMYRDKSLN